MRVSSPGSAALTRTLTPDQPCRAHLKSADHHRHRHRAPPLPATPCCRHPPDTAAACRSSPRLGVNLAVPHVFNSYQPTCHSNAGPAAGEGEGQPENQLLRVPDGRPGAGPEEGQAAAWLCLRCMPAAQLSSLHLLAVVCVGQLTASLRLSSMLAGQLCPLQWLVCNGSDSSRTSPLTR